MIVLTLSGTLDELHTALSHADTRADLLELRLDRVSESDVGGLAEAARSAGRRWIAACRPTGEGGNRARPENDRLRLLRSAVRTGAERVDVEAGTGAEGLLEELPPERLILSRHDADLPGDAASRLEALLRRAAPPAWVKYVPVATRAADLLTVRELAGRGSGRAIVFAAGTAGRASRALGPTWGSLATYAVPDGDDPVAAGQPTMSELLDEWDARGLEAATPMAGIGGRPLGHSLSPAMHNAALKACGRRERLLPFEAADMDDLLRLAAGLPVVGLAVTVPYKTEAVARCARLGSAARACGSVNTLTRHADGWRGDSTDGAGFLDALGELGVDPALPAAILGAGGSAAAVAAALRDAGATVTVHARRGEQAQRLAARLGVGAGRWTDAPGRAGALLVNATPVGLADPEQTPLPPSRLGGVRAVADLVYGVAPTRLVADARAAGLTAMDGLGMLVAQGERQFAALYGEPPLRGVMRAACRTTLERRRRSGGAAGRSEL